MKTKKLISIDFGQAFTKIAYLEHLENGFTLLNYALKKNASSEINRAEVVDFISAFLKENSILSKEAYLTVSESGSLAIKQMTLPSLPDDEMREAIKLQLKSELNFAASVLDWQEAKEYTDYDGAKKKRIVCVIVKEEAILRYLSIINECGLDAVKVSTSHFNYVNLLGLVPEVSGTTAVLDIGCREAGLCLYGNNKLMFVRNLVFSSDRLTHSLASARLSGDGNIVISPQMAEEMILNTGIPQQPSSILPLMRPLLESLKNELKRSFDYFSSRFKEESPAILFITGGGANIKNLDWYLNKELNIKASRLLFSPFVRTDPAIRQRLDREANQITSAVAAALAGPSGIDLLPPRIKAKKAELLQKSFLRVACVTLLAVFLFSLFIARFRTNDYRKRLKLARLHLANIGEIKDFKEQMDLIGEAVNRIHRTRVPADSLLKVISAIIPHDIILEELSLDQQNNTLLIRGNLSGSQDVLEQTLVKFMHKLEGTAFFREATLVSSKEVSGNHEFQIKCDLAQ